MPRHATACNEPARDPVHDIAHAHDTKSRPRRLSAASVAALEARTQRYELPDPRCAGLQQVVDVTVVGGLAA
jgi:hypothetical protein